MSFQSWPSVQSLSQAANAQPAAGQQHAIGRLSRLSTASGRPAHSMFRGFLQHQQQQSQTQTQLPQLSLSQRNGAILSSGTIIPDSDTVAGSEGGAAAASGSGFVAPFQRPRPSTGGSLRYRSTAAAAAAAAEREALEQSSAEIQQEQQDLFALLLEGIANLHANLHSLGDRIVKSDEDAEHRVKEMKEDTARLDERHRDEAMKNAGEIRRCLENLSCKISALEELHKSVERQQQASVADLQRELRESNERYETLREGQGRLEKELARLADTADRRIVPLSTPPPSGSLAAGLSPASTLTEIFDRLLKPYLVKQYGAIPADNAAGIDRAVAHESAQQRDSSDAGVVGHYRASFEEVIPPQRGCERSVAPAKAVARKPPARKTRKVTADRRGTSTLASTSKRKDVADAAERNYQLRPRTQAQAPVDQRPSTASGVLLTAGTSMSLLDIPRPSFGTPVSQMASGSVKESAGKSQPVRASRKRMRGYVEPGESEIEDA